MDIWQILCDLAQETWLEHSRELAEWLLEREKSVASSAEGRRGSSVCGWTMRLMSALELSLGDGTPDNGDRLAASGAKFDELSAQIAALGPDDGWQGLAAQAYLAQNLAQSQRVKLMGDLDHETSQLVSAQAKAIERVRDVLIVERIALIGTFALCLWYELMDGPEGQALSMEVAIAACAVALIVLSGFLVDLCNTTSQDHSELHSATQKLTDMLATLPTLSDPGPGLAGAPLPPSQSDPEFNVAGLFDRTGQLPEAAEISVALADLPGSVEFSVRTLPGPGFPDFGAPDLPVPGLAGLPTLPEPAALATPPAMAQLAAPLRRLTGLSGKTGALAKLTNTASQQAQLIAALTHDKPGTAEGPTDAPRAPVGARAGHPGGPQQRVQ